jgi:hypothetical protein
MGILSYSEAVRHPTISLIARTTAELAEKINPGVDVDYPPSPFRSANAKACDSLKIKSIKTSVIRVGLRQVDRISVYHFEYKLDTL